MYSKKIDIFKSYDIRLLRSLDDIYDDYTGDGIDSGYMSDCNIESDEVCQITRTPDQYRVGMFNENGCGTSYYSIDEDRKFIEGVDFEFI
jgi:hypothetical protein